MDIQKAIDDYAMYLANRRMGMIEAFLLHNNADPSIHRIVYQQHGLTAAEGETVFLIPDQEEDAFLLMTYDQKKARYPSMKIEPTYRLPGP